MAKKFRFQSREMDRFKFADEGTNHFGFLGFDSSSSSSSSEEDDVFEEFEDVRLPARFKKARRFGDFPEPATKITPEDRHHRVHDINKALKWLRQELLKIKHKDKDLEQQFRKIEHNICELKDKQMEMDATMSPRWSSASDSCSSMDENFLQSPYSRSPGHMTPSQLLILRAKGLHDRIPEDSPIRGRKFHPKIVRL